MGIRESLLNTITSVGNSDFVRVVTSAGASSKATVQNLFKSFETGLGAKSSLTTSDYIRVVGSDDVSYKQGMASVKSTLGVTTLESDNVVLGGGSITANSDLNNYGVGVWSCGSASIAQTLTNAPSDVASGFKMITMTSGYGSTISQYLVQIIVIASGSRTSPQIYMRSSQQGTWQSWAKVPTREEVDALNSKTSLTLNYTSNSYVTESTLKGGEAKKVGNLLLFKFNSSLSNFPTGSSVDNTQIGTISGWNASTATNITVSPQNGVASNGILLLTVSNAGVITISNRSGLPCNGFYRGVVVASIN